MTPTPRDLFHNYLIKNFRVSHETLNHFDSYFFLLQKWQKQINLTSHSEEIWERHFIDSVQLANFLPDKKISIIDIGSGGGFPSIPLAILGYDNITMIESDTKKCVFLKEALRVTFSQGNVLNTRIEQVKNTSASIVTSRACADLQTLLKYSFPFVSHGTICLFLKGKKYAMEIETAKENWEFDCKFTPSITSSEGVVLTITNIKKQGS
ncbi:MAG: 16S rRNA (guanine(527)-N(7))-methyltransferase RsmG [Alphaproteobacteria bacterium]